MALISKAELEARLGRTLTSEETTAFTTINAAAQAYVEQIIGSSVEAAAESTRYVDGGVQHLTIYPCTDISAVKYVDNDNVVDYTFDTSDYTKEPVNSTLKRYLRHRYGVFNSGFNNISITAKFSTFGDDRITAIIKDALLQYLSSEIQNSSNIVKESIEGYSVEYSSAESKSALAPIKYLFPGI